jgi:hypothetical protein
LCRHYSSECHADAIASAGTQKKRQERRMNDYVEELIELQSQQWDDDVEDAEEM